MSGRLVNAWTPGTTYPPGSVVRPTSTTGSSASPPTNADFETGDLTGWTSSGSYVVNNVKPYLGTYSASLPASSGTKTLINNNQVSVPFGAVFHASCYFNMGANTANCTAAVTITYYDSGHSVIGTITGNTITPISTGANGWMKSSAQISILIGTAYMAVSCTITNNSATGPVYVDGFAWDYLTNPYDAPLLFYAVQTGTGKSGQNEPVWATTPPNIVDGTVTWSSQAPTSITWRTQALLKSGSVEPTWPTVPGQVIHDPLSNNLDWLAVTPRIEDDNCPNSKYVAIASSKIFAADNDIIRFSATTDPTDWTTQADAGFLPIGLQNYGSNPTKAMGLYRSNLVAFNSQGLQMWQVDEDPANMALLDAIPIGSTQHRALAPVNNDLFFVSAQGVRTMGISAGSGNLQAGDVGMPIDPIVQAALTWASVSNVTPIGTYFPGAGQYWLAIPGWTATGWFVDPGGATTTTIFVYTMSRIGEVGAWSRYLIPVVLQDFCQNGDALYFRAVQANGDVVLFKVDPGSLLDQLTSGGGTTTADFTCIVQWPWLDLGQPGQSKQMLGLDFVVTIASGTYGMQVGYDQNSSSAFTTSYQLSGDTYPGMFVPFAVMAPSMAMRLTLTGSTNWSIQEVNLYFGDTSDPA